MLELIVLGKIPGTTIELTIRGIINIVFVVLLASLLAVLVRSHIKQSITRARRLLFLEFISL